jgi:hypothetical protein
MATDEGTIGAETCPTTGEGWPSRVADAPGRADLLEQGPGRSCARIDPV